MGQTRSKKSDYTDFFNQLREGLNELGIGLNVGANATAKATWKINDTTSIGLNFVVNDEGRVSISANIKSGKTNIGHELGSWNIREVSSIISEVNSLSFTNLNSESLPSPRARNKNNRILLGVVALICVLSFVGLINNGNTSIQPVEQNQKKKIFISEDNIKNALNFNSISDVEKAYNEGKLKNIAKVPAKTFTNDWRKFTQEEKDLFTKRFARLRVVNNQDEFYVIAPRNLFPEK